MFGRRMMAAEVTVVLRRNESGRRCSERQRVFFVFGRRLTAAEVTAVVRRNETGRWCSERRRGLCVRVSDDGGRRDGGGAEK